MTTPTEKPPYYIPLLSEIEAPSADAPRVVSLFTGAGGACLGFRMAGYRVVFANEFVEAARDTYRANFPDVPIDDRDIRELSGETVRDVIGQGEVDVLEGSPPCASFSTAGKKSEGWGASAPYSDTEQRTDDLFFEYARLLKELQPKVFVAENVPGLARGVSLGYLKEIATALKACGYRVGAQLIDASLLGVPQKRERIFFTGVREDLNREPRFPVPLSYQYTLADAIPYIEEVRLGAHGFQDENIVNDSRPMTTIAASGLGSYKYEVIEKYAIGKEWHKLAPGEGSRKYFLLSRASYEKPLLTVTAGGGQIDRASVTHSSQPRKFTIDELKRLCGFPDDFVLTGDYAQQWERLGRAVMPPVARAIAEAIRPLLS